MGPKTQKTSSRRAASRKKTDFSRDITLLIQHANEKGKPIARLLWETGITPKELVSLRKTDLDTARNELLIRSENTKNGQPRTITLSTQLTRALARHAKTHGHEHLFATRQSNQLSTRRVEQLLKDASEQAGIQRITPRDLRKTYQEAAANRAKDDEELRQTTGLKTIRKARTGLKAQQQERLEKALRKTATRERALIKTILETGKSLGEVLETKGKDIEKLTLTPATRKDLRSTARGPETHVFRSRQNERLTTRRAEQIISKIGAQARIRLTSRDLQATRGGAP